MSDAEPRNAPLEYSHCSRCKEAVDFLWDDYEKDWLSECCGAPAVPVDMEPGIPF